MKRKQMYKRIAAVFVSAAMLMGSMSMAYAEEPATEAATETEVISSEETSEGQTEENAASSDADTSWMTAAEDAPDVAGLECTGKLKLDYATGFDVYYYENDYALIDVHEDRQSRRIIHRADDFKSIGLVGVFIIKLQLLALLDTRLVCKCRRHQDPVFIRFFQIHLCIVNIR